MKPVEPLDAVRRYIHNKSLADKEALEHLLHPRVIFHNQDDLCFDRHRMFFRQESLIIAQFQPFWSQRPKSDKIMTIRTLPLQRPADSPRTILTNDISKTTRLSG